MSTEPLPRVSLCLLTYRRASILPRTLDSLLAQTHGDFELIINDDCSPDETESIAREYARRDPRVRYHRNPRNLRYAGNQNAAVRRAGCDYVGIVHDGDLYRADLLEQWTRALLRAPSAALVFNNAGRLDSHGRIVAYWQPSAYESVVAGRSLLDELLRLPGSPIFGIAMVRRSRVLEAGPFDPRLPVLADLDMWMRLLLRYDAAYVPEPLYAIAPREADHQNRFVNWRVRREQELIHALNYRRRCAVAAGGDVQHARLGRAIARMLWKIRVKHLLACARHGEPRALAEGLRYCMQRPTPLQLDGVPDSVLDWEAFDQSLQL